MDEASTVREGCLEDGWEVLQPVYGLHDEGTISL